MGEMTGRSYFPMAVAGVGGGYALYRVGQHQVVPAGVKLPVVNLFFEPSPERLMERIFNGTVEGDGYCTVTTGKALDLTTKRGGRQLALLTRTPTGLESASSAIQFRLNLRGYIGSLAVLQDRYKPAELTFERLRWPPVLGRAVWIRHRTSFIATASDQWQPEYTGSVTWRLSSTDPHMQVGFFRRFGRAWSAPGNWGVRAMVVAGAALLAAGLVDAGMRFASSDHRGLLERMI